jgi:heptosyltransferase-2
MRVGILKPDHLGDLVLAAPAIAALRRRFQDLTLFCQPATVTLAEHLFPGLPLRPVCLPHLDKERRPPAAAHPLADLRDCVDLLLCLRWDREMERLLETAGVEYHASWLDRLDVHVAAEHRAVVAPFTGEYDLLTSYRYRLPPRRRPEVLRTIGLCIAAGFVRNAWPLNHWLSLAELWHRRGTRVVLIGGPCEAAKLRVLQQAVRDTLGYPPRVLAGGEDFGAFLGELAGAVDLVVATDSGTAHLAALVCPVVSLFGGSPWKRYAPLGPFNAVVTRSEACSPCVQFDRSRLNTCHTQECLTNCLPEQVDACLVAYLRGLEGKSLRRVGGVWMAQAPWAEVAAPTDLLAAPLIERARLAETDLPVVVGEAAEGELHAEALKRDLLRRLELKG